MKHPTQTTIDTWIDSIGKQGYRRIKLRSLRKAVGAKRRGPALMADIDAVLAGCRSDGADYPLRVEWGRAEGLDDSVRIVARGTPSVKADARQDLPPNHLQTVEVQPVSASEEIVRAISIRQPYVEAILLGKKTVEYRSRKTNIRERVYLYASNSPGEPSYGLTAEGLPTGVIVGTIDIVDCTGVEGDYEIHLANPRRLDKHLKAKNQPQPMFWRPVF